MEKVENLVYSILFLRGKQGENLENLKSLLNLSEKEVLSSIKKINSGFKKNDEIFEIKKIEEIYVLSLKNDFSKYLSSKMNNKINIRLSSSLVEIVTIIAYKQPTTKPEIDKIRGVSSDYSIRKLLELELIKEVGRSKLPGLPSLFTTTNKFLEVFNLKSLNDLPKFEASKFDKELAQEYNLFSQE